MGQLTGSAQTIDFGGQSMATTSPTKVITMTNTGSAAANVSSVVASSQFSQQNNCGSLAPGESCTVTLAFSPAVAAGALNSTIAVGGTVTVDSDSIGAPFSATLAGVAEKSLVTHYYRSVLRRAPDAGGKAFWEGEASRMQDLGVNVNETWF